MMTDSIEKFLFALNSSYERLTLTVVTLVFMIVVFLFCIHYLFMRCSYLHIFIGFLVTVLFTTTSWSATNDTHHKIFIDTCLHLFLEIFSISYRFMEMINDLATPIIVPWIKAFTNLI